MVLNQKNVLKLLYMITKGQILHVLFFGAVTMGSLKYNTVHELVANEEMLF